MDKGEPLKTHRRKPWSPTCKLMMIFYIMISFIDLYIWLYWRTGSWRSCLSTRSYYMSYIFCETRKGFIVRCGPMAHLRSYHLCYLFVTAVILQLRMGVLCVYIYIFKPTSMVRYILLFALDFSDNLESFPLNVQDMSCRFLSPSFSTK